MDILLKFGVGSTAYVFQQSQQTKIDYNFADLLQQSVRVIGKDGAITPYGTGRAPAEMGDVSVSYIINGNDAFDVATQIDVIRGLSYRGTQRLFMKHSNGRLMWTWASISSVRTPQNVENVPHQRQRVQLNFQCQDLIKVNICTILYVSIGYYIPNKTDNRYYQSNDFLS